MGYPVAAGGFPRGIAPWIADAGDPTRARPERRNARGVPRPAWQSRGRYSSRGGAMKTLWRIF